MKIRGFIGHREVSVDLPVAQIAELGIDPWRLDLLDPYPVTAELCGRSIGFSRLSDVVFAYTKDETVFVGVRDGKTAVCFWGDQSQCGSTVIVTGFQVSSRPFGEHLAEYLQATQTPCPTGGLVFGGDPGLDPYSNAYYMPKPFGPMPWYHPLSCSSLTLCADRLVVDNNYCYSLDKQDYYGAMFEFRTVTLELPDEINSVHDSLGRWNATVFGAGLFRTILGEKPESLDVLVNVDDVTEVKERLRADHGVQTFIEHLDRQLYLRACPKLEFRLAGCNYRLFEYRRRFFDEQICTVGSIRSAAANQVSGTRIGFADLAQRLVRNLRSPATMPWTKNPRMVGPELDLTGFDTLTVEHIGAVCESEEAGSQCPEGGEAKA